MRRVGLIGLAALLLLATGCRLDVSVGVDARADGSGTVRVEVSADAELLRTAGSDTVLVDDLRQAGWKVDGPAPRPGGGAGFVATKAFADPAGARLAFQELGGPFGDLTLRRDRNLIRTTTSFRGTVDFTKGLDAFGDEKVAQTLGGSDLGIDPAQIEAAVNGPVDRAFGITVAARLPGAITASNAPSTAGNGATWQLRLRDKAVLEAESRAWNTTNITGLLVAVAAVVGLLVLGLHVVRGRRPA